MAEKTPSIVGRNVRRLRESLGMSGNALAKAAGMAQSQVWDLEAGRTQNPTAPVLQALARALGVTVDALLQEDPQDAGGGPQVAGVAMSGREAAEAAQGPQETR